MKKIIALMLFLTFFAHANDSEPGSQYLKAAEAGDRRAQYFLADSWFSSGDLSKAEYWAQKAADSGDADACALLAQIKITNPVSLDYPQAKVLAEKAAQAGSKEGEVTLAHILVNTQAGKPDYPKAISLLKRRTKNAKAFHDKCENFSFRASNETAVLITAFYSLHGDHLGYG